MIVTSFDWNDANIDHIARHRVTPDEAEEVFQDRFIVRRSREGRYVALGRSEAGRYLMCVFEKRGPPGCLRIITALDMDHKERKLFHREVSL